MRPHSVTSSATENKISPCLSNDTCQTSDQPQLGDNSIPPPAHDLSDTLVTPWKSAPSLHEASATAGLHPNTEQQANAIPSSMSSSKPDGVHVASNTIQSPKTPITQRIRRFSNSRPSPPTNPPLQPQPPQRTCEGVIITNVMNKEYDPATGNKIINKYMIIKEIGRGVHGKVKLAQDIQTSELVAIKIVDRRNRRRQMGYSLLRGNSQRHLWPDEMGKKGDPPHYKENEQKIRREIAILKKCSHPNVVRLREVIDDPASRKIYMALEYTEGGEIEWRDENENPVLSMADTRRFFRDAVSGLDYLHYQGIIHRDIKPANLLLTKEHVVKISDFGVSYFNELLAGNYTHGDPSKDDITIIDRELAETAGTPAFFAPELCCAGDSQKVSMDDSAETAAIDEHARSTRRHSRLSRPRVTKAIDVWALGVTLYCFVFGRCPFTAATEFELFDIIPTVPLTFPDPAETGVYIDDDLKDLLHKLLTKNADERITLDEVKRHPWVIADLDDPEVWWEEADPRKHQPVQVTDQEVTDAVTMMDRLRKSFQKLSTSFSSLTQGLTRRRGKHGPPSSKGKDTHHSPSWRRVSYQPSTQHHQQRLSVISEAAKSLPLLHAKPNYSTSTLPYPPLSPADPPTTMVTYDVHPVNPSSISGPLPESRPQPSLLRPISSFSDETSWPSYHEIDESGEEDEVPHWPATSDYCQRPELDQKLQSESSSSGMAITFGRYRES
ncbi:kinase-like domain-containing protein [Radiomyces spectabilis]|uniref:kinase-like domain-containing protein n=1 Tax=Radiomyces spectabilis TaxID=64574 RepID=UPI0022211CC1|nr:kinase-like domain-containing protein [Radiomyces spectabilis]KAI8370489.1 kinase-like domain-containing protein [Radiomyces spectabilis]